MKPLLMVNDLHIHFNTYAGTIQAVRGVNFHINQGEIVGLVGESGSGKSVIAQSILQLLGKDGQVIKGEIFLENENLLGKSQKEMEKIRGKKISLIFQDPLASLNPTMRIGHQLMESLLKHTHLSHQEAHEKALYLLTRVGISDVIYRMNQYPHEFSGGMRQRVLIAIALACQPLLIIADEPTTSLDVTIQAQILDLLKEIQQQNTSILFITHDLGAVAHLCNRVLVIYGGQIIESAPIDQLFAYPQHPYTQALLKSKASLSLPGHTLFSIPGNPPNLLNPPKACLFTPRCHYAMKICQQTEPFLEPKNSSTQVACWLQHKKDISHDNSSSTSC